jgi:hypothetical protein
MQVGPKSHVRIWAGLHRTGRCTGKIDGPESIDGQPVDVLFLLLLPEGSHRGALNAPASVARKLRDADAEHDNRQGARFNRIMD